MIVSPDALNPETEVQRRAATWYPRRIKELRLWLLTMREGDELHNYEVNNGPLSAQAGLAITRNGNVVAVFPEVFS